MKRIFLSGKDVYAVYRRINIPPPENDVIAPSCDGSKRGRMGGAKSHKRIRERVGVGRTADVEAGAELEPSRSRKVGRRAEARTCGCRQGGKKGAEKERNRDTAPASAPLWLLLLLSLSWFKVPFRAMMRTGGRSWEGGREGPEWGNSNKV